MRFPAVLVSAWAGVAASVFGALDPADNYQPRDTQPGGENPPPPQEAVKKLELPPGFHATLFAGEPDVRQPIDLKIDDRGRVWVCEAYSYQEWQRKGEDRIIILTDLNADGVADERKIFRGGFKHLSSVEIGFGGVWVLETPHLLFIPDRNRDDIPDGEPEVLLEGWTDQAGHNVVNGLMWGIDGWLYGRHGITQPSLVGKPGAPKNERIFIEPGVWRIHPVTRRFEVVLRGMTNPWGLDWDERGELFLSGNVNGHLWHGIPGALYERMFGAGSVPHDYERLHMIGERPHYPSSGDWRQDWLRADKGRDATNELGGGHSHCGLMIYQGDNWPEEYRGRLFMCNTHGRRVNMEEVTPQRSSFVGKHVGDVLVSKDPWFRGVNLVYGPDGGVFLADWCDNGECHDSDGVHRSSGRIYKITWGQPRPPGAGFDLGAYPVEQVVGLVRDGNEWMVRHSRRLIQEWASAPGREVIPSVVNTLRGAAEAPQAVFRLRAILTLHACGWGTEADWLTATRDADDSVRGWGARLLVKNGALSEAARSRLLQMAGDDPSPRVRLHLASLIGPVPNEMRWQIATALARRVEDIDDKTIQMIVWYRIEPHVSAEPDRAAALLRECAFSKVRQFLARRLATLIDDPRAQPVVAKLIEEATDRGSALSEDILTGIRDGLHGRTGLTAPSNWAATSPRLLDHPSEAVRDAAVDLSLAFGDAQTIDRFRRTVRDRQTASVERQAALTGLIRTRADGLKGLLDDAFQDPALRLIALRGYRATQDPGTAQRIVAAYAQLTPEEKQSAIDTLVSRHGFARELLEAVVAGRIPSGDITTTQARLILALDDSGLKALLAKAWGTIATSDATRRAQIDQFKEMLSRPDDQPADAVRGKAVFARVCSACHLLFGEGGKLGPDLTGSGRKDLDYLVRNIVDPSAIVPRDYQMTIVTLKDGQVLSGVVPRGDDKTLTLQSIVETRVLDRSQIAKVEPQPISWMPEGLLQSLEERQVRDLVAYLRSDGVGVAGGR